MADLIVLAGCAAIEQGCRNANENIQVPFTPGRGDASQEQTDQESLSVLEPTADAFINYLKAKHVTPTEKLLINQAQLLTLSVPEMSVLLAGMRVIGANFEQSANGVLTSQAGTLSNDFFVNLLDMNTVWEPTSEDAEVFIGRERRSNNIKWTATRFDLVFGSNSQLRAVAEFYACEDANKQFIHDFVKVWDKVMNLDRFDIH